LDDHQVRHQARFVVYVFAEFDPARRQIADCLFQPFKVVLVSSLSIVSYCWRYRERYSGEWHCGKA
jgi:hypothetical protein